MSVIYVPVAGDAPFAARSLRREATPSLSVLVASRGERARLERSLDLIVKAAASAGAEVLVARPDTPSQLSELARTYNGVRFIMAPAGASIPELLSIGMAESSGHIIELTDDERATTEDWDEILAHRGGVLRPGPGLSRDGKSVDWLTHLKRQAVAALDPVRGE
ncbi:MAG: hypothetical protein ABI613_11110 [Gemmatimonadota bacterium]